MTTLSFPFRTGALICPPINVVKTRREKIIKIIVLNRFIVKVFVIKIKRSFLNAEHAEVCAENAKLVLIFSATSA
jgi:hypothetical protein